MTNGKMRHVDATKAALFVMLALALVTVLIFTVFIPDIRKLKIAHMAQERAYIALEQTRAEHKMQLAKLEETRTEHQRALQMLGTPFAQDRFHQDAVRHFAHFEIQPAKTQLQGRFEVSEYNITAELREPSDFYEFVTFLGNYQSAVELEFPILIKADDRFLLNWAFSIRAYKTLEDQPRP